MQARRGQAGQVGSGAGILARTPEPAPSTVLKLQISEWVIPSWVLTSCSFSNHSMRTSTCRSTRVPVAHSNSAESCTASWWPNHGSNVHVCSAKTWPVRMRTPVTLWGCKQKPSLNPIPGVMCPCPDALHIMTFVLLRRCSLRNVFSRHHGQRACTLTRRR